MSKTKNKTGHIIKFIGICVCSISFFYWWTNGEALKLFDDLLKTTEQSRPIDKIFNWETSVENLYAKSLSMIKNQNMVILKDGIEELTAVISQQSNSPVNKQDVMNILYDTSAATKKFASFMNGLIKRSDTRTIPTVNIDASYVNLSKTIPSCIGKATTNNTNISEDEKSCIKKRIEKQYSVIEKNATAQESFKLQNFWEDFFSNGTLDDSNYDLIIDIQNIWNILFTSFIGPTETLFYRMPKGSSSSATNMLKNIANAVWDTTNWWTTSNSENKANNWWINTNPEDSSNNWNTIENDWTKKITNKDSELEDFINSTTTNWKPNNESTNTTSSTTTTNNTVNVLGITEGNLCLPTVTGGNTKTVTTITDTTTIETIQEYLEELDTIENKTTTTNDYSPESILKNTGTQIDTNEWWEDEEQITAINQLVEAKINNIFDEKSTETCTSQCSNTSAQKKIACNKTNEESKIICDGKSGLDKVACNKDRLSAKISCLNEVSTEEILCKIKCLCFSIQYPKYGEKWLEWIDGQLKVRFCTIPVQQNRVNKQSDILSRDDSLGRIKLVFEKLLNGGEMVKYAKPKEYLDIQIAPIERAKYISFEVKIYVKSLFSKKTKKDKEVKVNNERQKTEQATKGESKSEVNWNRNSIGYDAALGRTTAATTSQENIQTNIDIERENEKLKQLNENISPVTAVQNSKNKKSILFNEQMNSFLEENSKFRWDVKNEIENFNKLGASTKQQIMNLK